MELSPTMVAALLTVAIVAAGAAVVLAALAIAGQRRVSASYRMFDQGTGDDVLTLLQRHIDDVAKLREDVAAVRTHSYGVREMVAGALSRVHTVRYDAFDDMGGRLSFSSALLDEHGDGMVITAINGRTDTRVYAKAVRAGESRHTLSDEEARAIRQALLNQTRDGDEQLTIQHPRIVRDAS